MTISTLPVDLEIGYSFFDVKNSYNDGIMIRCLTDGLYIDFQELFNFGISRSEDQFAIIEKINV